MIKKIAIFIVFILTITRIANAEYTYPADSDKHDYAAFLGGIGVYGSQCERTSEFHRGLVIMQMEVLYWGWNVTETLEQVETFLEIAKTEEFKQNANRVYREGCDNYRQRVQPLINNVLGQVEEAMR